VDWPVHFFLEVADGALRMCFGQQSQAGLNGGPFGTKTSNPHYPVNQALIDFDGCTHKRASDY
jgi:hypothetical protein